MLNEWLRLSNTGTIILSLFLFCGMVCGCTQNYHVEEFIDGTKNGDINRLEEIMTQDFTCTRTTGGHYTYVLYTRSEYLEKCKNGTELTGESGSSYEGFRKVDNLCYVSYFFHTPESSEWISTVITCELEEGNLLNNFLRIKNYKIKEWNFLVGYPPFED